MESLEQELMIMLRRLPIPIMITWSGQYRWQCAQGTGESPHLINAVEQALRYLLSDSTARLGTVGIRNDAGDPVTDS